MNGISVKGFGVRSFMINGLTAKWGIGENRVPPIWDNNLIGYWDARDLPNGALASIPNKATLATKAPDLIVTGATMANGTLQFDGVNDGAVTSSFMFPEKYTIFWDIDWLGTDDRLAGIVHYPSIQLLDRKTNNELAVYLRGGVGARIPNTSVGISTSGRVYAQDGTVTQFRGQVGNKGGTGALSVAKNGSLYAQIGFRQLLIFNKELSPKEVAEVLRVMYPPVWDTNMIGYWDARGLPNGEVSTIANKATLATKAPDLTVTGATMVDGTLQFDGVNDGAFTAEFLFPEKYTIFWDIDWLGTEDGTAGIVHYPSAQLFNRKANDTLAVYLKDGPGARIPNTNVGISTDGRVYARSGAVTQFGGTIGDKGGTAALFIAKNGTLCAQLGFRQLLIFNKELTQEEVNMVVSTLFTP